MELEHVQHYAQDAQREERGQVVHIPASLQGRKGSYNRITRTVAVKGTCTVRAPYWMRTYDRRAPSLPAEFGIVAYQGRRYAVVRAQGEDFWEAVELEPAQPEPTEARRTEASEVTA